MEKCTVNLVQSYETQVNTTKELNEIVSDPEFKRRLEKELLMRNLDESQTVSERPITKSENFALNQDKHIDYQVAAIDDAEFSNQQYKKVIASQLVKEYLNVNIITGKVFSSTFYVPNIFSSFSMAQMYEL